MTLGSRIASQIEHGLGEGSKRRGRDENGWPGGAAPEWWKERGGSPWPSVQSRFRSSEPTAEDQKPSSLEHHFPMCT